LSLRGSLTAQVELVGECGDLSKLAFRAVLEERNALEQLDLCVFPKQRDG